MREVGKHFCLEYSSVAFILNLSFVAMVCLDAVRFYGKRFGGVTL